MSRKILVLKEKIEKSAELSGKNSISKITKNKYCQSRGTSQAKFKAPFTREMKKSLSINNTDSQPFSCKTSRKWGQEYFDEDFFGTSKANKRGKKLSGREQIALEINH